MDDRLVSLDVGFHDLRLAGKLLAEANDNAPMAVLDPQVLAQESLDAGEAGGLQWTRKMGISGCWRVVLCVLVWEYNVRQHSNRREWAAGKNTFMPIVTGDTQSQSTFTHA
jgi:hypothetical protein